MSTTQLDDILTDDRIEAMRTKVQRTIREDDNARRGRSGNRLKMVAAAAVLVVGVGIGGLVVGQQFSESSETASYSAPEATQANPAARAPAATLAQDSAGVAAAAPGVPANPVNESDREVITTGRTTITVTDPSAAAQQISQWVDSVGGRVDSRQDNTWGSSELTVRIPATEVTAAVERLRTYGTVQSTEINHQDVTSSAKDLDARIGALRVSIDRLTRILSDARSSAEVIEAESALTQRQEQLESLVSQRASISDQVALSTLTISLQEKVTPVKPSSGGFLGGLSSGWNALGSAAAWVVKTVGVLLPWLGVAVVLAGLYWLVRRALAIARRPRNRVAPADQQSSNPPESGEL